MVPIVLLYITLSGLLHHTQGFGEDVRREQEPQQLKNVMRSQYKHYPWEYIPHGRDYSREPHYGSTGDVRSSIILTQILGDYGEANKHQIQNTNKQNYDQHAIKHKRNTKTEEGDKATETTSNNGNGADNNNNIKIEQNTQKYKMNMTYAETKDILEKLTESFSDTVDFSDSSEELNKPFTADPNVKENGLDMTTPKYENIKLLNAAYNYVHMLILPEQNTETLQAAREFEKAHNKSDIVIKIIKDKMKKLMEDIQEHYPDWIEDANVTTPSTNDPNI